MRRAAIKHTIMPGSAKERDPLGRPHPHESPQLEEWRHQTDGRHFAFAVPDDIRCTATRQPGRDVLNQFSDVIYRCGKATGHDGQHECSDEGAVTLKWGLG